MSIIGLGHSHMKRKEENEGIFSLHLYHLTGNGDAGDRGGGYGGLIGNVIEENI